jgi:hypothetical protein
MVPRRYLGHYVPTYDASVFTYSYLNAFAGMTLSQGTKIPQNLFGNGTMRPGNYEHSLK